MSAKSNAEKRVADVVAAALQEWVAPGNTDPLDRILIRALIKQINAVPQPISPHGGGIPHSERDGKCARDGDVWPCAAAMVAGVEK